MEIIPALYVSHGKCVSLYKSDFEHKSTYVRSPIQTAKFFEKEGAKKIHIVDLDTRHDAKKLQKELIHKLTLSINIPVQLEATFRNGEDIKTAFQLGISKISLRPFASELMKEALQTYGPEKIYIEIQAKGSDVQMEEEELSQDRKENQDSTYPIQVVDYAEKLIPLGVKNIIYKDEHSEGTLIHPNYDEVDRLVLLTGNSLNIYVSGGIGQIKHLEMLKKIGAKGAIVGRALIEGAFSLEEAMEALGRDYAL